MYVAEGSLVVALVIFSLTSLAGLTLYFVPWIVAFRRGHPEVVGIGLLNLFLGWTLVGWVVALVWAVKSLPAEPLPRTIAEQR